MTANAESVFHVAELLRGSQQTAYAALARGEIPGGPKIGRTIRGSSRVLLDWSDPLSPSTSSRAPRSSSPSALARRHEAIKNGEVVGSTAVVRETGKKSQ